MAIPGLKVVVPSTPVDMVGLFAAAVRDPDPVIVVEPKVALLLEGRGARRRDRRPARHGARARGRATTSRSARSGRWCPKALAAAERARRGRRVGAEVIDVRSLVPLDVTHDPGLGRQDQPARHRRREPAPVRVGSRGLVDRRGGGVLRARRADRAGDDAAPPVAVGRRARGSRDPVRRPDRRGRSPSGALTTEAIDEEGEADGGSDPAAWWSRADGGPQAREHRWWRRPDRRRHDRGGREGPERGRRGDRRLGAHRDPRLRRHASAHVGDGDPQLRPERHARRLLRGGPRQLRAALPARRTCTRATWPGSLECINAGITTLVDWSHINNTPDHPDAGIQGLTESGIRALYAYGSANTSLADYWFNSSIAIPRDDVERIHSTYFGSDDGLLTMGLATRGPGFCQDDVVREEWGMARDLGIPITMHISMGKLAGKWSMVKQLDGLGLLGADTTYIHCCYFSDEEWDLVAKSQGTISIAPQVEMQMGHGWPPIMKARCVRSAAEPVDRRRDDGARRHVHRDALRVRCGAVAVERFRLGERGAVPRGRVDRRRHAADGDARRRARGGARGSRRVADAGQEGRRRRDRREGPGDRARSSTRSPRSSCAPTRPTSTP